MGWSYSRKNVEKFNRQRIQRACNKKEKLMNNSYENILKQYNVEITKEDIFPLFRKSKHHDSIVKFTDTTTGSIVRESSMRDLMKHRNGDGSLGKLGYTTDMWVKYDDKYWWVELTNEELLEFDENYKKEQEKKFSTREKLKAMSLLMSSFMHNIDLEQEVLDALLDISEIGTANNEQ